MVAVMVVCIAHMRMLYPWFNFSLGNQGVIGGIWAAIYFIVQYKFDMNIEENTELFQGNFIEP